jgi:hypothetical protein
MRRRNETVLVGDRIASVYVQAERYGTDLREVSRQATPAVRNRTGRLAAALGAFAAAAFAAGQAQAETIIGRPNSHPAYSVELEPHLLLGWGFRRNRHDFLPTHQHLDGPFGVGPGLRASIPVMDNGFVSSINNNVAIGLGADFAYYDRDSASVLWLPVVLQWNFYITKVITVFGEPGVALRHTSWDNGHETDGQLVLHGGAKFMFGQTTGLTVRIGAPYVSVGVSFLL